MSWLRWEATFDTHPDVIEAGWEAAVTFERVARMVKLHGDGGVLPAKCWSARWLSRTTGVPEEILTRGMAACLASTLLRAHEAGGVEIPGWRRYQPDPSKTERQARWRAGVRDRETPADVDGGRRLHPSLPSQDERDDDGTLTGHDGDMSEEASPLSACSAPEPAAPASLSSKRLAKKPKPDASEERERILVALAVISPAVRALAEELIGVLDGQRASGVAMDSVVVREVLGRIGDELAARPAGLSADAWAYGFQAAIRKAAPNANYVLKAARGYDPASSAPSRNGHAPHVPTREERVAEMIRQAKQAVGEIP